MKILAAVTVLVAGLAATTAVGGAIMLRHLDRVSRTPVASYRPGDRLEDLPGYDYNEHAYTVLMPVVLDCSRCETTVDLYKGVATAALSSGSKAEVLWLTYKDAPQTERYLTGSGLPMGRIMTRTAVGVRLRAVPTVLVADRAGRITAVWAGTRALERRDEIVAFLSASRVDAK